MSNVVKNSAISDTCMFLLGMSIGILFNYIFSRYVIWYGASERHHYFVIGIVQILANAVAIRYVRSYIENTGLFYLGLLSSQSLVIRKFYPALN